MADVRVTMKSTRPKGVTKREWQRAFKQGFEAIGVSWWREELPRHFKPGAERRYGYAKRVGQDEPPFILNDSGRRTRRNPAYFHVKKRVKGHTRPLEWSGRGKRNVLSSSATRATSKRVRVTLRGGWVFNFRRPRKDGKLSPNMRAELLTTTEPEARRLMRLFESTVAAEINKPKPLQTVRQ